MIVLFTCEEGSFFDDFEFLFCFFHLSENASKLNGPPAPKAERLMVAAFAANGLNCCGFCSVSKFSDFKNDLPERGTTPSLPWKSLNAMSKLGPSSNIGPLAPRTGIGEGMGEEKEKLVGSLMFLKNGHLTISG